MIMIRGKEILYLSKQEVASVGMDMKEMVGLLEAAFTEKSNGNYQMPSKIALHTLPDDFLHAMPCWIDKMETAGIKWVGGYHLNPKEYQLPYISGLIILNDPKTGMPLCVMDCEWVTAKRTGAVSAMTAKYLANPGVTTVGVIGCGVQGRSNLEAMVAIFPDVETVYAYDAFPEASAIYAKEMGNRFGISVIAVNNPKQAVHQADILITAGPTMVDKSRAIEKDWLKKGTVIASIDSDFRFTQGAVQACAAFTTDDLSQFHVFRDAECIRFINKEPMEIGDIITGKQPGRKSADDILFACNIGLALCDMAVASEIYKRAIAKGIGAVLPL